MWAQRFVDCYQHKLRAQAISLPYHTKEIEAAASATRPADVMKDEIFRAVLRKRLGNL